MVLLPLPLSPASATISPLADRQAHVVDRVQGAPRQRAADLEVPGQVLGAQQRPGAVLVPAAACRAPVVTGCSVTSSPSA